MKIPFNRPVKTELSREYLNDVLESCRFSGDGQYTKKCAKWLENATQGSVSAPAQALMTTSGSHALDMAAWLCDIGAGDEVIMPSYTFSATANAFVRCGATIVFVDIRPDTMNINELLIEDAITPRTKAIVPMHYAGISCEMDEINCIAAKYGLKVVEDAAQALLSTYAGEPCGGLSDFGCFSFHETKNLTMGEGGALIIRDKDMVERAEIVREKGTNRSKFYRGEIDKYTWVDWGSSYLPSEFLCALLWSQLQSDREIISNRKFAWNLYHEGLAELSKDGKIELPYIPEKCNHNGHIFYIKAENLEERDRLIDWLGKCGISSVFHYIPLHSAPAGMKYGRFHGDDIFTTRESERLLRLPMYYGLKEEEIVYTIEKIRLFLRRK